MRFVLMLLSAMCAIVLVSGCDPGYSLTYRACDRWPSGSVFDVQSELERGVDVNALLKITDEYSTTPLHIAVTCGSDPAVVELLLRHGADVHATDTYLKNTPLYEATRNINFDNPKTDSEVIASLLEHGADTTAESYEEICYDRPNVCEITPTTILYSAARNSDAATIKLLLEHGADSDINTTGLSGDTPLQARANVIWPIGSEHHTDAIRLLLEHGADINMRTEIGFTPLHLMAEEASPSLIQLMLEYGADVNAQAPGFGTPLNEASCNPNPAVARMLLEHGADSDIDATDRQGNTPLHRAVQGCRYPPNLEIITMLLERGANSVARNLVGRTPLHSAVLSHNSPELKDIIELLLEYGANPNATDDRGNTPCQLTEKYEDSVVRRALCQ